MNETQRLECERWAREVAEKTFEAHTEGFFRPRFVKLDTDGLRSILALAVATGLEAGIKHGAGK